MTHDAGHVIVPDLVGVVLSPERLSAFFLGSHGLHLVSSDRDGPTPAAMARQGGWVVLAQEPAAGAVVERWSTVAVVAVRRGGGQAGDREPREPRPPSGLLPVELDEPAAAERPTDVLLDELSAILSASSRPARGRRARTTA